MSRFELHRRLGLDPFLGMVPAAVVLFGVGYVMQRWLVNLVVNAPIFITLLLTFGLELIAGQRLMLLFTADYRRIPTGYAARSLDPARRRPAAVRTADRGGCSRWASRSRSWYVMRRTRTGLSILATGMDRGAARLMGIRARHVYALTFGIAAALAGAAGAAVGAVSTFSPADAGRFTLFSFVAAVLGGLGNMSGALLRRAGARAGPGMGGQLLPGTLVNAVAFGVLVVVLAVRPARHRRDGPSTPARVEV